jgi:tRNA(Ile)-lysidine synthase
MSSPERHELETLLAQSWPPADWADVTILLAVSGGCDSVALLRAIHAIRQTGPGRICVAHVNHQLRVDADHDEAFVVQLCRQLNVHCEVGRVSIDGSTGIEAAARSARYQFLEQAAERLGARYVVTAHTADDQVETILHRIVRGTGIGGLVGMARTRPIGHATLIRPLLKVRHAVLEDYLNTLGKSEKPFCIDSSNTDLHYTRNRIRHELLPWLEQFINPAVDEGLLRLGHLAGEVQAVIDPIVDRLFDQHVKLETDGMATIDVVNLSTQPRYVLRELLMAIWRRQGWPMQAMGFAQWEQLADLAVGKKQESPVLNEAKSSQPTSPQRNPPRQIFPGNVSAEVVSGRLRLARQ